MNAPCPTCARLAAEAEYYARACWWTWWRIMQELEAHRRTCEIATCNNA